MHSPGPYMKQVLAKLPTKPEGPDAPHMMGEIKDTEDEGKKTPAIQ